MADLKRQLGLLDSTMINVGTIIASAIFIVPSAIAATLQATGPAILVWVVGGVVSLLGALSVAELGAAMPHAGGQYVYLTRAYGPASGFLYGWTSGVVINPASIAAIAVGFATYFSFFVPLSGAGIKLAAVLSIVGLTALNSLGVRLGAVTQNVLTLIKMALLVVLIVAGFALPGGSASNLAPLWSDVPPGHQIASFGVALVAVLWAYDGWIEVTYVGGEVTDPERNVPRSIVLSTVIGIALYCLVTASFAYVLSPARMAASSLVASDAAQVTLGRAGAALVAVAIMIATIGSNNGIVLTAARVPYAMARDGLLPRWLGGVHPRFLTPVPSLVVQGIISIALTWISTEPSWKDTYNRLFTYVILGEFIFYGMSAAAVILLRHTAADMPRPYRTWGYPVTPLVFVLFSVWLIWNTAQEQLFDFAVGMALILAGLPLYWWMRRRQSSVVRHPSTAGPLRTTDDG
ncbi:MAG TPA: amino acid permease [Gemmatimonadales bacterium]|nr:amino acid permease [Gemmatimonadales bacterium]